MYAEHRPACGARYQDPRDQRGQGPRRDGQEVLRQPRQRGGRLRWAETQGTERQNHVPRQSSVGAHDPQRHQHRREELAQEHQG